MNFEKVIEAQNNPDLVQVEPPKFANGLYATFEDLANVIGPIRFAWEGWLALGQMSILASESGKGKSAVVLRVCGSFIKRLNWPDGSPFTGEAGSVLWCEAEAAQALNLERALSWGYPLNKIITPFDDPLTDVNLDYEVHQAAITQRALLPEVKFIVVDSLSGSTNKKENDTEIKRITEYLARLARDTCKPLLLTHHLNKGIFGNSEITLDRLRGSSAIVQHARVIWALDTPDPNNPDSKRLLMIKNNLRKWSKAIGITIGDTGVTFGPAPTVSKPLSVIEQAQRLIKEMLKDGPCDSEEMEAAADEAGISIRTLREAKKNMGVLSRKVGTHWVYSYPQNEEDDEDV